MTDYSKLSNLFTANQRLVAYNTNAKKRTDIQKQLADVNGDGTIDSKDKKIIQQQIKEAQKQKVFDFDADNDIDVEDWSLLDDEIDLDGDGEVSDEEKNFLTKQKKSMKTQVQKSVKSDKYSGEFDGKMYKDGKVLTGFADDGKYYSSGKLKTGNVRIKENGKSVSYYFVNGEKAQGKVGSYLYKDGEKFTGVNEEDGLYYASGKVKTGTVKDGNVTLTYKKGVLQSSKTTGTTSKTSTDSTKSTSTTATTSTTSSTGTTTVTDDGYVLINGVKYKADIKYDATGKLESITATNANGQVVYSENHSWDNNGIETVNTSEYRYDTKDRITYEKDTKSVDGKLTYTKEQLHSYGEATNNIYGYKYNHAVMTNTTDYGENDKTTVTLNCAEYNGGTLVGSVVNKSDGTKSRYVQTSSEGFTQDTFNLNWDENNNLTYFYKKIRTSIGYMGTVPYYSSYTSPSTDDNTLPSILKWNGKTAVELSGDTPANTASTTEPKVELSGGSTVSTGTTGTTISTGTTGTTSSTDDKSFTLYNGKLYQNKTLYTGLYNNTYFVNGSPGTDVCKENGLYYQNGSLYTGSENGVLYTNGAKYEGMFNNTYYKDGVAGTGLYKNTYFVNGNPGTGVCEENGLYYQNGSLYTGSENGNMYVQGKKI